MKYPMDYDTFQKTIHDLFINDDNLIYEKKFSKKEKQDFINNNNFDYHRAYEDECTSYDRGNKTVFDEDNLNTYLFNLAFECFLYHQNTSQSNKEINETKYPLTYTEFEKLVGKLFVKKAPQQYTDVTTDEAKEGWKQYLNENKDVKDIYEERCQIYDNPSQDRPKEMAFDEEALSAGPVYYMVQWVFF